MKNYPWRSLIALILIILIPIFNLSWLWAVLLLFWAIPDLISGQTFLLEPVTRKEFPVLFWAMMLTWLLGSAWILLDRFAPQTLPEAMRTPVSFYSAQASGSFALDVASHEAGEKILRYKTHRSPAFEIVGFSTATSTESNAFLEDTEILWNKMAAYDPSTIADYLADEKLYSIQSPANENGEFTVTVGYRVEGLGTTPNGMIRVAAPAAHYAVVEITENPEENLVHTWEKIMLSDLEALPQSSVEVYHFKPGGAQVEKIDVWVPTSTQDPPDVVLEANEGGNGTATGQPEAVPALASGTYDPKAQTVVIEETVAGGETRQVDFGYPVVKLDPFWLVGIQKTVEYDQAEKAVEQLWADFYKKDHSKNIDGIVVEEKAFCVYSGYTETHLTITLGYMVAGDPGEKLKGGLAAVYAAGNDYHQSPMSGDFEGISASYWDKIAQLLPYRDPGSVDVEEYVFDKKLIPSGGRAWIATK